MKGSKRSLQDINNGDKMKLPPKKRLHARETMITTCVPRIFLFELVSEILIRLPIEEIFRCKTVCKPWRDIINSSKFIKSHILHTVNMNNISSSIIFFSRKKKSLTYLDFQSAKKIKIITLPCPFLCDFLVGSCNGLLCFGGSVVGHFSLCNPITGASKPTTPFLVYQNHEMQFRLGFGYDYLSDDYKILAFTSNDVRQEAYSIRLYSLKSDSWKKIRNTCRCAIAEVEKTSMVFSNNALNWITSSMTIRGFDLGSEKFHDVPMPDDLEVYGLDIIDLRGCLHLVTTNEIWVMKEYPVKQSWTKLFDFGGPNFIGKMIMPSAYSQDGRELLVALTIYLEEFSCLDLHHIEFKKLEISGLPTNWIRDSKIVPWLGS